MKKIITTVMVVVMLFSISACGTDNKSKQSDNTNKTDNPKKETDTGDLDMSADEQDSFCFGDKDSVALEQPKAELNPNEVLSNITYTPQMFYGTHRLLGGEEAAEELLGKVGCYPGFENENGSEVSLLPIAIECGRHSIAHACAYIKQHEWAKVYFQTEEGYSWSANCAYEINGNKITFTPLEEFNYDKETNQISYALSDNSFEYEFSFSGMDIILSKDGEEVNLRTGLDVKDDKPYFSVDACCSTDSEMFQNIKRVNFLYSNSESRITITDSNKKTYRPSATLTRSGLFTFTIPKESGNETYQLYCFYCHEDGLVLSDGNKVYYYNESYSDKYGFWLGDSITIADAEKLQNMEEDRLEEMVEKKENLLEDLTAEFAAQGISVKVDKETGEMAMDAAVLFGGDSAVVTDEGKALIDKFLAAYTSIIYNEKYNGFISKTIVEGHIAPISGGTYESGLPLSEERANHVKEYCLSGSSGIDTSKLAESLEAVGYSNSKPVYKENGDVDMEACRRVVFRFIINVE